MTMQLNQLPLSPTTSLLLLQKVWLSAMLQKKKMVMTRGMMKMQRKLHALKLKHKAKAAVVDVVAVLVVVRVLIVDLVVAAVAVDQVPVVDRVADNAVVHLEEPAAVAVARVVVEDKLAICQ
jgi:hypothetical protein